MHNCCQLSCQVYGQTCNCYWASSFHKSTLFDVFGDFSGLLRDREGFAVVLTDKQSVHALLSNFFFSRFVLLENEIHFLKLLHDLLIILAVDPFTPVIIAMNVARHVNIALWLSDPQLTASNRYNSCNSCVGATFVLALLLFITLFKLLVLLLLINELYDSERLRDNILLQSKLLAKIVNQDIRLLQAPFNSAFSAFYCYLGNFVGLLVGSKNHSCKVLTRRSVSFCDIGTRVLKVSCLLEFLCSLNHAA